MSNEGWSTGKKVLVFGCGTLLLLGLLCGGGAVLMGLWAKDKVEEIQAMTPAERAEFMQETLAPLSKKYDPTVDAYLDHLAAGDFTQAYAMTSPGFQAVVTEQGLADLQDKIDTTMGAYQSRWVTNVNTQIGSNDRVTLKYQAVYANGSGTLEMVLVPAPTGGGYVVEHYKVNSPLFLQALPGGAGGAGEDAEEPR